MKRIVYFSVLCLIVALSAQGEIAVFNFSEKSSLVEMGYDSSALDNLGYDAASQRETSYARLTFTAPPVTAEWTNTYIFHFPQFFALTLPTSEIVNLFLGPDYLFNFDKTLGDGKIKLTVPAGYEITRISAESVSEVYCNRILFIVNNPDSQESAFGAGTYTGDNIQEYIPEFSGVRKVVIGSSSNSHDVAFKRIMVEYIAPSNLKGDLNGDGEVGIADLTLIINDLLEEEEHDLRYDINNDLEVSMADLTMLINIMLSQE